MSTVGVVIFSTEGMKHLGECLKSVAWADEILLLHAGTTPPELPTAADRRIKLKTASSLVEAAAACDEIGSEWVLSLWGDERVGPELKEELQALRQGELRDGGSACRIPIRSYLLGGWAVGSVSGVSPALRLRRRSASTGTDSGIKTEEARVLRRGWIEDYSCAELSRAVDYVQLLSDFWARRSGIGRSTPGGMRAVLGSLRVFFRILFANGIFFCGLAGVALAALAGYAVLLSEAKLWEARYAGARESASKQGP
jgi:hypothetical protein